MSRVDIPESATLKGAVIASTSAASKSADKNVAPARVPRPSNAWILYRADMSRLLSSSNAESSSQAGPSKHPGVGRGAATQVIAKMWTNETDEVKAEYKARAEREKEDHKLKYPGYKFQPRRNGVRKAKEARKPSTKQAEGPPTTGRSQLVSSSSSGSIAKDSPDPMPWLAFDPYATGPSSAAPGPYSQAGAMIMSVDPQGRQLSYRSTLPLSASSQSEPFVEPRHPYESAAPSTSQHIEYGSSGPWPGNPAVSQYASDMSAMHLPGADTQSFPPAPQYNQHAHHLQQHQQHQHYNHSNYQYEHQHQVEHVQGQADERLRGKVRPYPHDTSTAPHGPGGAVFHSDQGASADDVSNGVPNASSWMPPFR